MVVVVAVVCVSLLQIPLESCSGTVNTQDHFTHETSDKKVKL